MADMTFRQALREFAAIERQHQAVATVAAVLRRAADAEGAIGELEQIRDGLQAETATLKGEIAKQRERLKTDAEKAIAERERGAAATRAELERRKDQVTKECKRLHDQVNDERDRAQAELQRCRATIEELKQRIAHEAGVLKELTTKVEEIRSRADSIRGLSA
jgi:chromosome segregation ATPase